MRRSPDTEPFSGHQLYAAARQICGDRPYFHPEQWEECMQDVIVAILSGEDPEAAARRTKSAERNWRSHTTPFFGEIV